MTTNTNEVGSLSVPNLSNFLVLLFAISGGVAVGSLYLAQPLLEIIAKYFSVPSASTSKLVTVTQVGYAVGIFLLVPLGDVLQRHRFIPAVLLLAALSLFGAAMSPTYGTLLFALAAVGLTSVAAQLLLPLASELSEPETRGRTIGTIAAGALIGILLSRTVSGVVADVWNWRAIYFIVGGVALVLAIVLSFMIPRLQPKASVPYFKLLGSVFTSAARYKAVLPTLLITGSIFAVFSMFWTALTFLLSTEPFNYSTSQIGLMGIAGLAGAIAGRRAGAMHDRGWSVPATGLAIVLLAISLIGAWMFQTSIIGLVVFIVILDVAVMGNMILGQTRLLALSSTERSRLNTAVVVFNFAGGAVGSLLAGPLWALGGWSAIMIGSLCLTACSLLVWLVARSRLSTTT
ncbi:MFS transporter [Vibrio fluvialis]|nr:MFS transporter [Vibrio fluvialis]